MRNVKRGITGMLAVVMTVSCLLGCGGGTGNSNSNSTNGGKVDADGKKIIQVLYWKSGLGDEWLNNIIAGFEKKYPEYKIALNETANIATVAASLGNEDVDENDLYLGEKVYDTSKLEPLDDVLAATADGDTKTIGEKFNANYLELETAPDGKHYNLTYGGGIIGIIYNQKMFEDAGISTLPRTTDELALVCDMLYANGQKAFCHFKATGYWEWFIADVLFAQYDGWDYVKDNFYACKDENGNSPSKEVFTKKDGRYQALKVMAQIVTPEYTMEGSNTYDHTTIQTMFLNGEAAMMVSGSWMENEMASTKKTENFEMMRMPVVSAITDKLTTVKTDAELRKLITAIDSVTDGEKQLSDYQQGEDFAVDGLTVSAEDWEYVRKARNSMSANYSGEGAFIPSYADQKEGAKKFLEYFYSDEGYRIYMDTLHLVMPLSLCDGEPDTGSWSAFEKNQYQLYTTTEQFVTDYIASKHSIFVNGGARRFGGQETYVNLFCSKNSADRMTADEAWELVQDRVNDRYENVWLLNMK